MSFFDEKTFLYNFLIRKFPCVKGKRIPFTVTPPRMNMPSSIYNSDRVSVLILNLPSSLYGMSIRGCANFIRRSMMTELWLHPTTGDFRKNGGPHSLITETVPILEKSKEILGVDHPSTVTIMANLAETCRQQGRTKEACQLEEEVLEKRKQILESATLTRSLSWVISHQHTGSKEGQKMHVSCRRKCFRRARRYWESTTPARCQPWTTSH